MHNDTRLLAGVRVLDLSIWRPGPYATSLLVALGADTLKVEPPGGDPMRHYAGLFETINRGKRSLELNLKDRGDQARAMELASEADVVIEGFRPGVMARLGLDDAAVRARNHGVVYCSISGYGQDDPRAALPGHDVNYQAWAAALTPEEGAAATIPPLPVADLAAGMTAAFGVCAALLGRASSGRGTFLDVSMTDVLSTWTGRAGAGGGGDPVTVPGYGLFTTADGGQLSLGVLNEQHFWSGLCQVLELGEMADLDFAERTERGTQLQGVVRAAIAGRKRDELVSALADAGMPVAPVLTRTEMLSAMPFPAFPIRIPTLEPAPLVPALDEHHGQGFLPRG
jgi:crotonobetainyl-CoA:carnitine CoA-transferase CaiB-like acyl-CoA transferase